MDPSKIKVRSFMGLVGFYRKFVRDFSRIAYPITSLQRKGKKFIWTEKCQSAFEFLKEKLTTAPILRVPDPQNTVRSYNRCIRRRFRGCVNAR